MVRGGRILEQSDTHMQAAVDIAYLGVQQTFTTHNTLVPNERIDLALLSGRSPVERPVAVQAVGRRWLQGRV